MKSMTIRSQFQPAVDEFIGDLHEFATGAYLKEGETEFWEEPFDPAALPELKGILERLLDALDVLPDDPPGDLLAAVVQKFAGELNAFNDRQHGAVVEQEEHQFIDKLVYESAAATGADDEALGELPDLEQ